MTRTSGVREVCRVIRRIPAIEGAGVLINRVMPLPGFDHADPFLLLDEIRSSDPEAYISGFPPHPHRGIETVTYMLAGRMHHRDSTGGDGVISAGDVQWMTAGRGIVHSEMPEQQLGLMWGFQLWLNMPASEKMSTASSYVELKSSNIPEAIEPGVTVRVISGRYGGLVGPAPQRATEPLYLDAGLTQGAGCDVEISDGHAAFIYVYEGELIASGVTLGLGETGLLSQEGMLKISTIHGARALILAGRPLKEPIVRGGPFVMASEQDLREAFADLRAGTFLQADDALSDAGRPGYPVMRGH